MPSLASSPTSETIVAPSDETTHEVHDAVDANVKESITDPPIPSSAAGALDCPSDARSP